MRSLLLILLLSCAPVAKAIRVQTPSGPGGGGTGSAFAVLDRQGVVRYVTAGHVCAEAVLASKAAVREAAVLQDGTARYSVHRRRMKDDLCELKLQSGTPPVPFTLAEAAEPGTKIRILGYPVGIRFQCMTTGEILGRIKEDWLDGLTTLLLLHGDAYFGNSGGPVVNEEDEVVGVLVGEFITPGYLTLAIPLEALQNFLAPV